MRPSHDRTHKVGPPKILYISVPRESFLFTKFATGLEAMSRSYYNTGIRYYINTYFQGKKPVVAYLNYQVRRKQQQVNPTNDVVQGTSGLASVCIATSYHSICIDQ